MPTAKEIKRELLLHIWRTKTLNQTFYLLSAAATTHGGISLFFNLCHACRSIGDGIDNISFKYLITGTKIPVQILFENWGKFVQRIFVGIVFQSMRIITIKE